MHLDYLDSNEAKLVAEAARRERFETWYSLTADAILLQNAAEVLRKRAAKDSVWNTQARSLLEDAAGFLIQEAKQYA